MTSILKVDNLQNSSGTSAMTIDSSGRILTPARPAWSAYRASSPSNQTTQNAWVTVPWNATSINDGNFNTSTYTYTTPVAGLWHIMYSVRLDNANAGSYIIGNLAFDGSLSTYNEAYVIESNEGVYHSLVFSGIFELAASVAITNQVYVNNDTSWSITQYGHFSGFLVG